MDKITRAAFLYMEGEASEEYAQCSTCALRPKDNPSLCAILGIKIAKPKASTCELYVHGEPICDEVEELVTPEEAGFVETKVQCQRCEYGGDEDCEMFKMLNKKMPQYFDLETRISKNGCCNAWISKTP